MSLGFLEDKADPGGVKRDENGYVLGLIPYEKTTTYGKGVARAPEAIVEASGHVELFDEVLAVDASRHGILTARPKITSLASITKAARRAMWLRPCAGWRRRKRRGADRMIRPGMRRALRRRKRARGWIFPAALPTGGRSS
jgi:arginase family enzyme